mmetsp:Transcript_7376/g.12027  ORF Transcript_7376/g.12027 Transcript_7376/m.12027 type:complete len:98 (-) Transcript_7376:428-721(-)
MAFLLMSAKVNTSKLELACHSKTRIHSIITRDAKTQNVSASKWVKKRDARGPAERKTRSQSLARSVHGDLPSFHPMLDTEIKALRTDGERKSDLEYS